MKFNWGHGILIALILIVVTFSTALILSFSDEKDHQLVAEDYYAKELAFQDQIDRLNNAKGEGRQLATSQDQVGLKISVSGISKVPDESLVELMRPSDETLDLTGELDANGKCSFEQNSLKRGKYTLKISWTENGTDYFLEKQVFIQ